MNRRMSAAVRSCPHMSPTEQDRTGQDTKHVRDEVEETYKVDRGLADFDRRFGLDRFDPEFVRDLGEQMRERARHVARGPERLAAYLAAPPEVQADFDRRQAAAYYAETEAQRLADDTCTARQFEAWLVEADDG